MSQLKWIRVNLNIDGLGLMLIIMTTVYQEPAGIFELIEVVGNGTYGQVFKVKSRPVIVKYIL